VLASTGWRADAPPSGAGAQRERWENVAALVRLAEQAQADGEQEPPTLATFVAELAERAAAQHAPTVQGVTIASLHSAKGLEWDAVFLVGLVEGVLPISHAVTAEAIAEERRLLYVGVTRARRHLTLSWARAREAGRRGRKPSRFLEGLGPAADSDAGPVAGRRAKRRGGPPPEVDLALWEKLRQWRAERAAAQKQPAFCVFTDDTLAAIATRRPATLAQLRMVPGVGSTKLERFGPDVLELLQGADAVPGQAGGAGK
jgi:DNA helicase-2/ATP-dependent DNA helicase PcrA